MGAVLTGMVGSDDLRVDSPEAQGLCPAEEGRGRDAAATDKVAAIDELPARLRARTDFEIVQAHLHRLLTLHMRTLDDVFASASAADGATAVAIADLLREAAAAARDAQREAAEDFTGLLRRSVCLVESLSGMKGSL